MDMYSDIKDNYLAKGAKYFADKYKKSILYVYNLASKAGQTRGTRRTSSLKEAILKEYFENKLSVQKIHEKLDIGKSTIGFILAEVGGGRSAQEAKLKTYSCDESFFEEINTPEKAYWFGFIAADGNLHQKKLQICLAAKDKDHLNLFCQRINFNGVLFKDGTNNRLIIARKKIHDDLIKNGMAINKTFKINEHLFDKIPEKYISAAMLGYFDGDGSFSIKRPKKYNPHNTAYLDFNLVGNESFLSFFQKKLTELGIKCPNPKKDKRTKNTYYIVTRLTKERARILYSFFYEGENSSKDFLDRKKKRLTVVIHDGKFA